MALSKSTIYFLQMMLGACVLFAGVGTFVAYHDKDYKYNHKKNTSEAPPGADDIEYYSALTNEEKRIVQEALEDGPVYLEERGKAPDEVIRTSFDHYMIFTTFGVFDWLNPLTFMPVVGGIFGLGTLVDSIRRDIRNRGL